MAICASGSAGSTVSLSPIAPRIDRIVSNDGTAVLAMHPGMAARLVLAENTLLLVIGLAIGAGAALLAVSPHVLAGNASVPWLSLAVTLLLIVVVGTLAAAAAVRRALAAPLLPALKSD